MKLWNRLFLLLVILMISVHGQKAWGGDYDRKKCDLAICAIFKNEARFLREWIEFHRLVGVQRFYLYNNSSTDDYLDVLYPYIKKKIVHLIDWPTDNFSCFGVAQCTAYDHAIRSNQGKVKWLAVIDTDEFLFPVEEDNLLDFLSQYEEFGGLCVNWQMYGTSNVNTIPQNKLLIETLVRKAPLNFSENIHVKSIVKPDRVDYFPNPHTCNYKPGFCQVNADKEAFSGPFSPYISVDKICINHYWSRDEDFFFNVKLSRRKEFGDSEENSWTRLELLNSTVDDKRSILRFVAKLRKRCFN